MFLCLVHRLSIEARMVISPNVNVIIDVQRTQDASLIKTNENIVAPRQDLHSTV